MSSGSAVYVGGDCRRAISGRYIDPASVPPSPDSVFGPALAWSAHQVPGPFTDFSRRPRFIHDTDFYVDAHPQIRAALYWNAYGQNNACDYTVNDGPAIMARYLSR